MATITADGFYITGDDYRKFERDQDVRRLMVSYHWTGDRLVPKAFLVTKPRNEVIKSYVTLNTGVERNIESPVGISTFFINNSGVKDQFEKIVKQEIEDYNRQHGTNYTVTDIEKLHFTPTTADGPGEDPVRFLALNFRLEFPVYAPEPGMKAAPMSLTDGDKTFQPSPPAQPDDI